MTKVAGRLLMTNRQTIAELRQPPGLRREPLTGEMVLDEALDRRNKIIRQQITDMSGEKSSSGIPKYTSAYVFEIVAQRHKLKVRTVKNIFWETGSYCPAAAPAQNVGQAAI